MTQVCRMKHAATGSWNCGEHPRPRPRPRGPEGPDVGDGPLGRLTLAAVGEIEAAGQLIYQVARRFRERPAFPPDLRVTAVVDAGVADMHPVPIGDDDRVARV